MITPITMYTACRRTESNFNEFVDSYLDTVYPVGSIYISVSSENPSTLLGGGSWIAWGSGRVPVGVDVSDSNFSAVEKESGTLTNSHKHTSGTVGGTAITTAQMPSHTHTFTGSAVTSGTQSANHTHSSSAFNTGNNSVSHTHSIPAQTTSTVSAGHTHSIPALSGSAASNGAHTHASGHSTAARFMMTDQLQVDDEPGGGISGDTYEYPRIPAGGAFNTALNTASSGAHTHTVTTVASTTGGISANHTHTTAATTSGSQSANHTHSVPAHTTGTNSANHTHSVTASGTNSSTGSGNTHTHTLSDTGSTEISTLQPYITCYMWKRVA